MSLEILRSDLYVILKRNEFTIEEINKAIATYHDNLEIILPPEQVILAASAACGIASEKAMFKNRKREYVIMRCLVWLYFHKKTTMSLSAMGRIFDNHHTTVLHGISQSKIHLKYNDPTFLKFYNKFSEQIKIW